MKWSHCLHEMKGKNDGDNNNKSDLKPSNNIDINHNE